MQFHYIPSVLEIDNTAFRDVISHLLRKREREREREREKQVNAVSTISILIKKNCHDTLYDQVEILITKLLYYVFFLSAQCIDSSGSIACRYL